MAHTEEADQAAEAELHRRPPSPAPGESHPEHVGDAERRQMRLSREQRKKWLGLD